MHVSSVFPLIVSCISALNRIICNRCSVYACTNSLISYSNITYINQMTNYIGRKMMCSYRVCAIYTSWHVMVIACV